MLTEQSQTAKRGVSDSKRTHVEDVPLNKGAHFLAPFDQSTSLSPPSTPGADENSKGMRDKSTIVIGKCISLSCTFDWRAFHLHIATYTRCPLYRDSAINSCYA